MTTTKLPIIGFTSNGSLCGKSTAAKHLTTMHRYYWLKLSAPFKKMLRCLFVEMGFSETDIDKMMEGCFKHTSIAGLGGKRPVDLMITLGQDWGRNLVHDDIWVNVADMHYRNLTAFTRGWAGIVIDDVRQPNEFDWIKKNNGLIIRIERPEALQLVMDNHLRNFPADFTIKNDSDITALCRQLDSILMRL